MKFSESLEKNKKEWEELAELDSYWFILTDPHNKFGRWKGEDFFKTGETEINNLIYLSEKLGYPSKRKTALDFGCGVGRLTSSLAKYFKKCYGVDISENMINKAKILNKHLQNCEFIINEQENLNFSDNYFDLIYTTLVLQHIPNKNLIKKYISEFARVLKKNGLLVFQLPSQLPVHIPLVLRIFNKRTIFYEKLKKFRINKRFLYDKLKLFPSMTMNSIPEEEILEFLGNLKIKILKVQEDICAGPLIKSRTYYITK